ncbi:hypothetical protein Trisim1_006065 [Trichoderma cf. simile WF8]
MTNTADGEKKKKKKSKSKDERATRHSAKKKKLSAVLANERSTDLDQDSEEHLEPKPMKDRSNKVQREQVV